MEVLDWALGAAEVALVAATLGWLLSVLIRPSSKRLARGAGASLLVGLTLAQPFGLIAQETNGVPSDATRVDVGGVHAARVLGELPLFPFVLYRRDYIGPRIAESSPEASLRARSWFWLPVVTNATLVSELCSGEVSVPCWTPHDARSLHHRTLRVYERDGDFWAVVENPNSERYAPGTRRAFSWKLDAGVVSPAGLFYWVAAGILMLLAYRRLPDRAARAN